MLDQSFRFQSNPDSVFKAKLCAHLFLHSEIKGMWLNCESIKYEKKKKGDDCDGNEIHQNFSCTFCLQGSQSEPGVSLETYRSPPSPAMPVTILFKGFYTPSPPESPYIY